MAKRKITVKGTTKFVFDNKNSIVMTSESQRNYWITNISQLIFQCPTKPSGLISMEAEIQRYADPNFVYTREHYFPRKKCATKIVEYILGNPKCTYKELYDMIDKATSVHFTTSEENTRLRTISTKAPNLPWERQYELAGIELVPYYKSENVVLIMSRLDDNPILEICGTQKEAADWLGCSPTTVGSANHYDNNKRQIYSAKRKSWYLVEIFPRKYVHEGQSGFDPEYCASQLKDAS